MKQKLLFLLGLMFTYVNIVHAANTLKVQGVEMTPGESISLSIELNNTTRNLMGWQCDIVLPNGLSLALKSNGKPIATLGSRFSTTEHTISSNVLSNGSYRFIATSMDGEAIPGTSGTLFSVTLQADASLKQGTTLTGKIQNIELNTQDNQKLTLNDVSFTVSIPAASGIDITKYITAASTGGAIMQTNDLINSGSQLSWSFSNSSTEDVTLKSMQLIDGKTGTAGNVMSVNKDVEAGKSVGYTTTIGAAGIHTPVTCRFRYEYKGVEYSVDAVYSGSIFSDYKLSIKATGNGSVTYSGSTFRNTTKTFTVDRYGSVTITFSPDDGYQIKSVKVNGSEVTITNNRYYNSMITRDTNVEVEFEAIPVTTYTLSITASSGGSVSYNGNTISNTTNSYTLDEGASATLTFTPNNGYRIKSVKVNNSDVTSNVANNKYTISSISQNTTVNVTFEAIPTYTLSITSNGSGKVTYSGTTINGTTKSFTVDEGATATLNISPNDGNHVKSVIVNNSDVTSQMSGNQFVVNNITTNTTVTVTFEADAPSIDITKFISASSTGGAVMQTNDLINSGSQLGWSFSNSSTEDVTLKSMQLIDGKTGTAGNIMSVNKVVEAGNSVGYTTTIGAAGIHTPVTCRFRYEYKGVEYFVDAVYKSIFEYTLSVKATGNGSVSYSGSTIRNGSESFTVDRYDSATFTFTPDNGYRVKSVKVNGSDVTSSVSNNKYTISSISRNTNVEVEFEAIPVTYTLSITASGDGSVSYDGNTINNTTKSYTLNEGTSATLTITPNSGYRIKSVKVNNSDVTSNVANNKYTISSISQNTTVSVIFEAIPITTYTLSITAFSGGSVSYNGNTISNTTKSYTLNEGTSVTLTITPNSGYRIKSVTVNNSDVTSSVANNKYTISDISQNTTVSVMFEAIPPTKFSLTITAFSGGSVSYNGNTISNTTKSYTLNEGTSVTLTITPNSGYRIKSVKVNNSDVTTNVANNKYTISDISQNMTVSVTFEVIPPTTYILSITSSGNGYVLYAEKKTNNTTNTYTVTKGSAAILTFVPNSGYRVGVLKVNNVDVTSSISNNQYTINNIDKNTTISVTFEAIPITTYSLSITSLGSGYINYSSNTINDNTQTYTVNEGASIILIFVPSSGYRLTSLKVDGVDVTSDITNDKYEISSISKNTTIVAEFVPNKYKLTYVVNGEVYKTISYDYGASVTPEPDLMKDGYTFSGWSWIPSKMPAEDVTVTATFTANKYKLIYKVDGEVYKSYDVEYGASLNTEAEPTKEGYTFSGWSWMPSKMPAEDVTVTGSFTINKYKLTYQVDGAEYKTCEVEYGSTIIPEPQPEGDYVRFAWVGIPEKMPAHDVTVTADFETGITDVVAKNDIKYIYGPNGKRVNKLQKGVNIVVMKDGTTRKIILKSRP